MSEMALKQGARVRLLRWAAIGAIAAAFLHSAILSWGKWGDLLIDCGMDLEDARMLLEPGHRLYVNPLYPYGPLIPHFNALLFKLFGVNLWVFCWTGLLSAALMTVVLYRMARLFIGRLGSAAAAIGFLYFCAFAQLTPNGSFNFVFSYRSCAQYGALLAAGSVYFLIRHVKKLPHPTLSHGERGNNNGVRDFWVSMLLLALAGLTKLEVLTAAAAAHLVFIVGAIWIRNFTRRHIFGYAAAVALVVGVYGYFYAVAGNSLFVDNIFQMAMHPNYLLYAKRLMGTDTIDLSVMDMIQSAGFFAAAFLPAMAIARLYYRTLPSPLTPLPQGERGNGAEPLTKSAGVTQDAMFIVLCGFCGLMLYLFVSLEIAFRFVPALGTGVLIWILVRAFKDKVRRAELLPLAILWGLAVGALSRMYFKTISYHYGFYLLPPGLAAVAVFGFGTLPRMWAKKRQFAWLCAGTMAGVFLGLIVDHLRISKYFYAQRTFEIRSPRGDMKILPTQQIARSRLAGEPPPKGTRDKLYELPTGEYWRDVLEFLSALPRDSRVLIVPHGSSALTFFSGLDNPYKDYVTAAPTLNGRFDDDEFLQKVKAEPPDYIIRSALDVSEYGQTRFGESYSKRTWAWLEPRYEVVKEYPEPRNGVSLRFIVILKKKT